MAASTPARNLGRDSGPECWRWSKTTEATRTRAVYTVRFEEAVYVLHAFQKKSKTGIATSQRDQELIARRLKDAIEDHEVRYGKAK